MLVEVAAAIIRQKGCYLIAKRKRDALFGDLWEFPGGKRRTGESLADCLRRELKEEMGVEVIIHNLVHEVLYPYPHSVVILYFYNCSIRGGEVKPLACQEFRWVPPRELPMYSFPPANNPLISELICL
ncbi:MAG: (deoxy)nucleoside triphosphate pyrophosphohydrolase [Nitrospiria bacterium]